MKQFPKSKTLKKKKKKSEIQRERERERVTEYWQTEYQLPGP